MSSDPISLLYKPSSSDDQSQQQPPSFQRFQDLPQNRQPSPEMIQQNIISSIQEYARRNPLCIAILTPCYGSLCHASYVTSLMNTMLLFAQLGIKMKVEFCRNDSLVSRARNNLIAKAMSDPNITHILFIDSDITWAPTDIFKLVLANKAIVGGVYPIKHYDWSRLISPGRNVVQEWINAKNKSQLRELVSDTETVQHRMVRYNINLFSNELKIQNNLTQVKHLATGFMMIQRSTIEKMSKAFPSTKYVDDVGYLSGSENDYAFALFDCGVENQRYMSEDWMFCSRWINMGGDVWVDVSINLNHSGTDDFKGSFIDSLM